MTRRDHGTAAILTAAAIRQAQEAYVTVRERDTLGHVSAFDVVRRDGTILRTFATRAEAEAYAAPINAVAAL